MTNRTYIDESCDACKAMHYLYQRLELQTCAPTSSVEPEPATNGPVTNGPTNCTANNNNPKVDISEMTSKDYYFDSYAHFGIHEVGQACFSFA